MRALVTGAGGMVGSALVPELLRAGFEVVPTDADVRQPRPWGPNGPVLAALDVRRSLDVEEAFLEIRPDVAFNLAAITDVDACEADRDAAMHTNALGARYVALAAQRRDTPLVHVSSADVFDGEQASYDELDQPAPINVHGRSKLAAEQAVATLVPRHTIVRTGWLFGGGARDHKLVGVFIAHLAADRRTLYAVRDKVGSPTYTVDLAAGLVRLALAESYGIHHLVNEGAATRVDLATRVAETLGYTDVNVQDVTSGFFAEDHPAPRPASEVLRNLVLDLEGGPRMRPWEVALEEYLKVTWSEAARP